MSTGTYALPTDTGASVTLDGTGTGAAEVQVPALESWRVTRIAVTCSSAVTEPEARVYVNTEAPTAFVGGTYTGSNDASDENLTLRPGQRLICRWRDGDPGAVATLSVFGEVTR